MKIIAQALKTCQKRCHHKTTGLQFSFEQLLSSFQLSSWAELNYFAKSRLCMSEWFDSECELRSAAMKIILSIVSLTKAHSFPSKKQHPSECVYIGWIIKPNQKLCHFLCRTSCHWLEMALLLRTINMLCIQGFASLLAAKIIFRCVSTCSLYILLAFGFVVGWWVKLMQVMMMFKWSGHAWWLTQFRRLGSLC